MSSSSQSTCPVGRVLWEELLKEVIWACSPRNFFNKNGVIWCEHITPLCSLLHTLLKDKCLCICRMSENCKPLVLQDKCNIEIFLSPVIIHNFIIFLRKLNCDHFENLYKLNVLCKNLLFIHMICDWSSYTSTGFHVKTGL